MTSARRHCQSGFWLPIVSDRIFYHGRKLTLSIIGSTRADEVLAFLRSTKWIRQIQEITFRLSPCLRQCAGSGFGILYFAGMTVCSRPIRTSFRTSPICNWSSITFHSPLPLLIKLTIQLPQGVNRIWAVDNLGRLTQNPFYSKTLVKHLLRLCCLCS